MTPNPSKDKEVFEFVVRALKKQKTKSEENGVCKYRSQFGKCAAGHLIKDEDYKKLFEGETVDPGNRIHAYFEELGYNTQLIRELQEVHDAYPTEKWPMMFEKVSSKLKIYE